MKLMSSSLTNAMLDASGSMLFTVSALCWKKIIQFYETEDQSFQDESLKHGCLKRLFIDFFGQKWHILLHKMLQIQQK